MALKYVVKKRVFGFDKTKTEKYVAQNVITNTVNFRDLCKEVSMFGMIPEGAVKHVIDALIDALNTNLNKGLSVQLGDFGCFRPGMSCKSQKEEKDVDADTVRRVKIVFTPGYKFKVIDYIITNFHLPKSTLFMLICAIAGTERMKAAYAHAVKERYRFYSYGDSSILKCVNKI
mgnify:FL=1